MSNQVPRSVLLMAVKLIKQWHDMPDKNPDDSVFKIYYEHAPEMKDIRNVLGEYKDIKDEIKECVYPDCGCAEARLCMAISGANGASMALNRPKTTSSLTD